MSGTFFILPPFDTQTIACSEGNIVYALLFPSGILSDYTVPTAIARINSGSADLLLAGMANPTAFSSAAGQKALYFRGVKGLATRGSQIVAEVLLTPGASSTTGLQYAFLDVNSLPQSNQILYQSNDDTFGPCLTDSSIWFVDYSEPAKFSGTLYRLHAQVSTPAFTSPVKFGIYNDQFVGPYACSSNAAAIAYSANGQYLVDRFDEQLHDTKLVQTSDGTFITPALALSDDGTALLLGTGIHLIEPDGKPVLLLNSIDIGFGVGLDLAYESNGIFGVTADSDTYMGNRVLTLYLAHRPQLTQAPTANSADNQFFLQCTDCYGATSATVGGKPALITVIDGGLAIQAPAPLTEGTYPVTLTLGGDLKSSLTLAAQLSVAASGGPAISRLGIANASSGAAAELAPGEWISIYGQSLAQQAVTAAAAPFPTSLGSVQVLINGQPVPLWFVSPGQINALVPSDIHDSTATVQIVATPGSAVKSAVITVPVSAQFPGLAVYNGDTIIVSTHGLISQTNPLRDGDEVTLYGSGFGATNPAVGTNQPAPAGPLANCTNSVGFLLGSTASLVRFAGLSPGGYGLYQLNVRIALPARQGAGPQRLSGTMSVGASVISVSTWY